MSRDADAAASPPEGVVPLEAVRRALVIKLRHHGDVLLASAVPAALKAAAPAIEIDALVYADTAPMLTLHPMLAEVHAVDRGWKRLGFAARLGAERQLLERLRARRYDLLVQLTGHWRGAWLARLLRPRWSVAPQRYPPRRLWSSSFTHIVPLPRAGNRHTVEGDLDALRRIGVQPAAEARKLVLEPGDAARERVAALLAEQDLQPGRYVHVHPASRWRFKCWTPEGWAGIIGRLHDAGWRVAMTAAPDAAELEMVAAIKKRLSAPAADFSGRLDLKELAALTAAARLFIGVDSAPMHIAAAVGTPAVALFGPSREAVWRPWGTPRTGGHRVVASDRHACRPCEIDGCGGSKVSDCLVTLEADRVWQAVSAELRLAG